MGTSAEAIGSQFRLGEWTTPSFDGAKNLQQFEFLNLGRLQLEAKVTFNVTTYDIDWSTGKIGEIGGNETKKMESLALRIRAPYDDYYSVSYNVTLEDGEEISDCSDEEVCGEKNGNGISSIFVLIKKKEKNKIPCDEDSPCQCEIAICYNPLMSDA